MSNPTENPNIWTVIIAIVTTLGGSKVWELWQKKLELSKEREAQKMAQDVTYRDDLWKRIATLEESLNKSIEDRQELMNKITNLSKELARLEVKVVYLERENKLLTDKLQLINGIEESQANGGTDER